MKKRIEHFHAPPWSVFVLIAVLNVLFFAPTASAVSGGDASVNWDERMDGNGIYDRADAAIIRAAENYYLCADDCVITYP